MVSVAGAQQAVPLVLQYEAITTAIGQLQAAVAAGAAIAELDAVVIVSGQTQPAMRALIPMSAGDSAAIFNALIAIYQNNLAALQSQMAAIA